MLNNLAAYRAHTGIETQLMILPGRNRSTTFGQLDVESSRFQSSILNFASSLITTTPSLHRPISKILLIHC